MKNQPTRFASILLLLLIFLTSYQSAYSQCGNVSSYRPTVSSPTVCSNNSVYVYATGLPVTRWIYRDNNTGSWNAISTNSDNYSMFVSVSSTTTRTFRAVVSTPSCPTDTTLGVDVTLLPRVYGTDLTFKLSASESQTCSGVNVRFSSMNMGKTIEQWLTKDGNGAWNIYTYSSSNEMNMSMPTVSTPTVRYVRVVFQNNNCTSDSSDIIAVNVLPTVNGNNNSVRPQLTVDQICSGTNVNLTADWPLGIGGWIYRDGSGPWILFSTSTSTSVSDFNTVVSTSTTRQYRSLLRDNSNCKLDTSAAESVFINASGRTYNTSVMPRLSGNNNYVCAGSSMSFNLSGFNNISTWQYRDSANATWQNFGGSSTQPSISSSSNITQLITRTVRVVLNNSSNTCSYDTSAEITYQIRPTVRGNTTTSVPFASVTEICAGATLSVYLNNSQSVTGWLYRDNGLGNWLLNSTSSSTFNTSTNQITTNTERAFRVLVSNTALCRIDTSPDVRVLIRVPVAGTRVDITPTVNQNAYCSGTSVNGFVNLSQNYQASQWLYRDNNSGAWLQLQFQTSSSFNDNTTSSITSPTIRSYRLLVRNLERFTIDSTLEVSVSINPLTRGTIALQPTTPTPTVCDQSSIQLQIALPTGYTVNNWLFRDTVNQFWNSFSFGSSSTSNFVSTTFSNRTYRVLLIDNSACRVDTTNALVVSVSRKTGRYNNAIVPIANNTQICSGSTSINISVSVASNVSVSKWMRRDNNGPWVDIFTSSTSYNESSSNTRVLVPTIRQYRVVLNDNNTCTVDTSAAVSVQLTPLTNGVINGITPSTSSVLSTFCSGTNISTNISTYSGGNVQKWIYRDNNNGPWLEMEGSSQSTFYTFGSNQTRVSVPTNRQVRAIVVPQGSCLVDTTQILTIQILPRTYGTAPFIQPTTSTPNVCSGGNANIQIPSNSTYSVTKWLYRNNNTGPWLDVPVSSSSTNYFETNTNVINTLTRSYRTVVMTQTCSYDTTALLSIQINPASRGYANSVTLTSNQGVYCSGGSVSANVISNTMPSGGTVTQWLYMDNMSGDWTAIPGSASTFMTQSPIFAAIPTTRSYRTIIRNTNTCSFDSSAIFSVSINPSVFGSTNAIIPTSNITNVCNASSTPTLNVSIPSGYTFLRWLMNDNATGWKQFPYAANSSSVNDFALNVSAPTTRSYRVLATNTSNCSIDSSAVLSISVNPLVNGNLSTVTPSTTNNRTNYCYGVNVALNVNTPSGYGVQKWIYSENNSGVWNDFTFNTSSNNINDQNTSVANLTTRSYRVIFINNTSCQRDTSAARTVNINPRSSFVGNSTIQPTASNANICSGSNASLNISIPSGTTLLRWTYSDNGSAGPWYDVFNSYNSTGISHSATQTQTVLTRLYRAIITDTSTCDLDSSRAVAVNINPNVYGTDTVRTITAIDSSCVGSPLTLSVSPGSGNSVNKWIYKDNGGIWTNFTVSSGVSNFTDNNTPQIPGSVREYTPIIYKPATCSFDTVTKSKSVYFKNKTYGNASSTVSISTQDTVCVGTTVNAFSTGTIERWLFRDGQTGTWNTIPNATSSSLSHSNTFVQGATWRYYRALLRLSNCQADTSNADSIFIKNQTFGNIAIQPTASPSNVCSGSSATVSVSFSGGNVQRWLYRDNNGPWNVLSVTSSTSINDANTNVSATTTRSYAAIVFKNCGYDTTLSASVTISPRTRGVDATRTPTVSSTTVCAGSNINNLSLNTSGISIIQWLYRNNGGAWQVFYNGNATGLTDYNTFVGSVVTRDYVAIVNNNTTCSIDTTNRLTVTINPIIVGNNSTRTPTVNSVACMGSSYNISMSVASDTTIIRMLYNENGGNWIDRGYINPTTSTSQTDFAYQSTSSYTRGYRVIVYKASNCRIDTTQASFVTINPRTYGNDNSITPNANATVCSNNSFNVSVSAGSGNSVTRWLYSDDNGTSWNTIFTSSSSISQNVSTNTVINRQYRALISKGAACTIDTTAVRNVTINPIVYGADTVAQVTVSGTKSFCTGSSFSVSVSGTGSGTIQNWLYSDNGGNWNTIYQTSNSITALNTNTSTPIERRYTIQLLKLATCRIDTATKLDTAYISPRLQGVDTTIFISSSNTTYCTGAAVNLQMNNLGSHNIDRWLVRNNGGAWSVLTTNSSTSIFDYNTSVTAAVNRDYVAIIRKANSCTNDTSKVFSVTIAPRSIGVDNAIVPTTSQTAICSGTSIGININPGSGNSIQSWLRRIDGGSWIVYNSSGSTSISDFNTSTSTSTVREYRALIVKGSGCTIDSSASVSVTINPIGFGNQNSVAPVANQSSICTGNNVSLSISGFSGTSILRWLYRDQPNAAWTVVNNGSSTFTDFNTNVSAVTARSYRAIINNTNGCSTDTSASTVVTINPITNSVLTTPTQASQATICSGSSVNLFINPGSGYTVHSWLVKEGAGNWELVSGSTATSINIFNTTVSTNTTRQYRAMLRNTSGCSLDSAASVTVNINVISEGTNLSIQPATSTPVLCANSTAIVSVSGFSGNVVRWLFRDSVIDGWNTINNTNFTLFHNNTFVSYSRTRTYRAIVYNAANCSNDTTAEVNLTINPQLAGNANAIAPTATVTAICSGSSVNMNITGFINGGTVTGWVFSDNGSAWTTINVSSATLNHNATSVTVNTSRVYRALVLTGCVTDTSAGLTISIEVAPDKPTVQRNGNTLSSSVSAATYQWKRNGTNISGATAATYEVTENGDYSVEIGTSAGCKTTSDPLNVTLIGVEQVEKVWVSRVYPNPTYTGKVWLDFNQLEGETITVDIRDITGRVVLSNTYKVTSGKVELDLNDQLSGIYLIHITHGDQSVTKRISRVR